LLLAYYKLFRAGLNVYESPDQDLLLVAVSQLTKGDAVICFSYSGKTKNILELAKFARENGITVISITNFPLSPLTKNSDIVLLTAAFTQHAGGEIVSKRITELCLIESLYVNILLKSKQDLDKNIRNSNAALKINKY
jgi:DNA-binding MurR/RpiR family transcriptional regulator